MEWIVQPGGYVPFEHVHINQDEIFHVQQGEIRVKINGHVHIGEAGQTVFIPRGLKHIAYNNRPEKLVCIVDYKPGLDHYKTMQCFAGLTLDGDIDRSGMVNIPKIMYLLKKAKARSLPRPAFVPDLLFRLGMNVFYPVGQLFGWESLYQKYTS